MARKHVLLVTALALALMLVAGGVHQCRSAQGAAAVGASQQARDAGAADADRGHDGVILGAQDLRRGEGPLVGRTAVLRVWRGRTEPGEVTVYPCEDTGSFTWARLRYGEQLRRSVRALPTTLTRGRCPRVRIQITGRGPEAHHLTGKLVEVLDTGPAPERQERLDGVDITSMDTIRMAGPEASGKVALLPMYRGPEDDRVFTAYPCESNAAMQFVYIHYQQDQREEVAELPFRPHGACRTLRFRLQRKDPTTGVWHARLLDIGVGP
jgi:hypothetical protein